jgi:Protein of unknown function (DUF3105)
MSQGAGKGLALLLVMVVVVVVLAGCGGDGDGGSAHVNEDSGATNGVPLDEREGTPPPAAKGGDIEALADKAGCLYFSTLEDEGDREVAPGTAVTYEASIPTSGPHVEPPHQQADGAYLLMPEPIDFVASLDHGRVAIQYSPGLAEFAQLQLKGLYDTMYGGTLLFPNEEMRFTVAATAWTSMLGCTIWQGNLTIEAVRAFAAAKWGKGGNEPVDDFPVSGPTPEEPAEPGAS